MSTNLESPGVLVTAPRTLDYIHSTPKKVHKSLKNDFLPEVEDTSPKTYSFDYYIDMAYTFIDSPDGMYIHPYFFYPGSTNMLGIYKFNNTTGLFDYIRKYDVPMIFDSNASLRDDPYEIINNTQYSDDEALNLLGIELYNGGMTGYAQIIAAVCGGIVVQCSYDDRGAITINETGRENEPLDYSISVASDSNAYQQYFWLGLTAPYNTFPLQQYASSNSLQFNIPVYFDVHFYNPAGLHNFDINYGSSYLNDVTISDPGIIVSAPAVYDFYSNQETFPVQQLFIPYKTLSACNKGLLNWDTFYFNITNYYSFSTETSDMLFGGYGSEEFEVFSTIFNGGTKHSLSRRKYSCVPTYNLPDSKYVTTGPMSVSGVGANFIDPDLNGSIYPMIGLIMQEFRISVPRSDEFPRFFPDDSRLNNSFYGYAISCYAWGFDYSRTYSLLLAEFNLDFKSIKQTKLVDISGLYYKSCYAESAYHQNVVDKAVTIVPGIVYSTSCLHYNSTSSTYDLYFISKDLYNKSVLVVAYDIFNNLEMGSNNFLVPKENSVIVYADAFSAIAIPSRVTIGNSVVTQYKYTYSWTV